MRILLISDHGDPRAKIGSQDSSLGGGQNIYIFYLTKFLSQRGIQVDIYTRWDNRHKRAIVHINKNLRVIRIQAGKKAPLPKELLTTVIDEFAQNILNHIKIEREHYDVIHSNYWLSGLAGISIAKQLQLPLVHVYHSIGMVRSKVLRKFKIELDNLVFLNIRLQAEKQIAKQARGIIATSPVEQKLIKELFHIPAKKIKTIPIGIDSTIFKPVDQHQARKHLHLPIQQKIILYTGRLDRRKGVDVAIQAVAKLRQTQPDTHLYIIGGKRGYQNRLETDKELHYLNTVVKNLAVQDNVHFVGPKPQGILRYYFSAADLCVIPSYYEPFGIVALEAMACGTPVVTSRTGGLQYSVKHEVTGYLAEPGNAVDFTKKIKQALKLGKMHFQKNCLKRIEQHFRWQDIAQDYEDYFKSLI